VNLNVAAKLNINSLIRRDVQEQKKIMNDSIVHKYQTFNTKGQLKLIGNCSRNPTLKKKTYWQSHIMNLLEDHSQVTEKSIMSYRETNRLREQTSSPKLNFLILHMLIAVRKLTQVVSRLACYERCC